MYPTTQVKAISFISVMSFIFLFCFIFNLSQAPQIFLNLSIAQSRIYFSFIRSCKRKKNNQALCLSRCRESASPHKFICCAASRAISVDLRLET